MLEPRIPSLNPVAAQTAYDLNIDELMCPLFKSNRQTQCIHQPPDTHIVKTFYDITSQVNVLLQENRK